MIFTFSEEQLKSLSRELRYVKQSPTIGRLVAEWAREAPIDLELREGGMIPLCLVPASGVSGSRDGSFIPLEDLDNVARLLTGEQYKEFLKSYL